MAVDMWVIWLIVAVLLGVAEIFTLTAALGLLGGAALVTARRRRDRAAAAAAARGVRRRRRRPASCSCAPSRGGTMRARHGWQRFGVDALVGRPAYVVQEVSGPGRHGSASAARSGPPAPSTTAW